MEPSNVPGGYAPMQKKMLIIIINSGLWGTAILPMPKEKHKNNANFL